MYEVCWANDTLFKICLIVDWHLLVYLCLFGKCGVIASWHTQAHTSIHTVLYSLLADTPMHTHAYTQSYTHLHPGAFLFSTSAALLKLWSPTVPLSQWAPRPAIHLSCIWVALWRPLHVYEDLDFNKDQPWLPAVGARPSIYPLVPHG